VSGRDAHFLARWSRRRQAVQEAESVAAEPASAGPATPADLSAKVAADRAEASADAPLPSIEDITPESDLAAFLRKGVPEAVKSAALRKMWSLDPNIRDFVGLSENAWNFNDPTSIPGFGAIADPARAFLALNACLGASEQAPPEVAAPAVEPPPLQGRGNAPAAAPSAAPVVKADPPAETAAQPPEGAASKRRHGGATPV
jgi:hypothetical protein